jgi:hypothetical protein
VLDFIFTIVGHVSGSALTDTLPVELISTPSTFVRTTLGLPSTLVFELITNDPDTFRDDVAIDISVTGGKYSVPTTVRPPDSIKLVDPSLNSPMETHLPHGMTTSVEILVPLPNSLLKGVHVSVEAIQSLPVWADAWREAKSTSVWMASKRFIGFA